MSYTLPEPKMRTHGAIDTTKKPWFGTEQMQAAHAAGRASRDAEVEALRADAERLDWLTNNFYSRENLDWITGKVSTKETMWVFFAPIGHQGNIRTVLDAAMREGEVNGLHTID